MYKRNWFLQIYNILQLSVQYFYTFKFNPIHSTTYTADFMTYRLLASRLPFTHTYY